MQKILLLLLLVLSSYAQESIRFGVFAYKGVEQTREQYQPLVDELNKKLDNRVILEILTQEELNEKVKNSQLDIITTNPTHFLRLRQELELSGAIATLRGFNKGVATSKLAGAIIVKKESSIKELKDLKNKIIATPSQKHLGGFRTQVYELYLNGIDILKDSKRIIETKSSHQKVLYTVLNGEAEVGFIRDGILEEMIERGEIKEDEIRVINLQNSPSHPYKISTKLYPEWPVFAMPSLNKESAKEFIAALLSIKPTQKLQDAGIYSYCLPADYLEVESLSRALRLPPFDKAPKITYTDILSQYKIDIIAVFILMTIGLLYHLREQKRKRFITSLLSNIGEGVYGIDKDGKCTWINKKALEMLGYSEEEVLDKDQHLLFHHHKPTKEDYNLHECPIYVTSKDKKTRSLDESFIRKDGSFIPINLTVTATQDDGAIVIFRDMSDFIEKKEALEKSENLFRTLFEIFPEPIVMIDTETRLPFMFNEAAHNQLGYSADEFKKLSVSQYNLRETLEEKEERVTSINRDKEANFEAIHTKKDGSLLDINVFVKLIHIEEKPYFLSVFRDVTQIKKYQKELYNQKQRLDYIIEGTNAGTWEWDIESSNVIFNERWAEIIGYTLEELQPTSINTWITHAHPDDLKKSKALLEKHFIGESKYYECEIRMKHKDGHWVWVLDRGKVSKWSQDGKPLRVSGTHQDITAAKDAQEALKLEQEMFANGPVIVIEWLALENWPINYVSRNVEKILGYTSAEMTENSFVYGDLIHRDDFENVLSDVEYNIDHKINSYEQSYRLRLKDGSYKWFYDFTHVVKDSDSNIVSFRGYLFDQTQLKTAQEELLKREKLLELFFRQSMYGFFFMMMDEPIEWNDGVDKERALDYIFEHQRVTKINEAMLSQYGAVESDFIGFRPKDFFEHNIEHGRDIWIELFDKGQLHIDTHEQKFDGSDMVINGDYICLYDERGFITGHFGVQREVTEDVLAKEALKEAKEEAERANESKSAFLANMSHEIRTPMNAILGLSEIVLDTNLDTKQADYIYKIQNSSKLLLNIINDILDFSKIEANKLEIESKEFALKDVLYKLRTIFRKSATDKGIEFYCIVGENVPNLVVSDELRINQILINLLGNAIKFTKEGVIRVNMEVTKKDEKSATILFNVIDTGIGLSQEQIEKLFKPFSQADSTITRRYGGTGLGLSISHRLASAMGGELKVSSKEGVGSTFSFEITVGINSWLDNTLNIKDVQETQKIQKVSSYPDLSHVKLLLVEDNEINQEITIEMLKRVKISADIANNGKEAVDIFVANPNYYDIILMDLQMPIMSGYEATKIIREHNKEIPIIALTAAAMIEDRAKALNAGMNDHLSKPIDGDEMLSNIAKWLDIDFVIKQNSHNITLQDTAVLDLEYAMSALNANSNLLYKILSKFLEELEDDFVSLPEFLYKNDEGAKALTHALKGVSSNIGAKELASIATHIDALLKKSIPIKAQNIELLKDAIKRVEDKIKLYLKENPPLQEEPTLNKKPIENDFKNLYLTHLEDIKNGTMVQFQNQQLLFNLLKTKVNRYELDLWMSAMDNFDYDKAYNIMKEWQL